jgi:hypothetical protein
VPPAEIGREMLDLSASFGFDVLVEAVPHAHVEVLPRVEEYLSAYGGGRIDELAAVLGQFMQLESILTPAQG